MKSIFILGLVLFVSAFSSVSAQLQIDSARQGGRVFCFGNAVNSFNAINYINQLEEERREEFTLRHFNQSASRAIGEFWTLRYEETLNELSTAIEKLEAIEAGETHYQGNQLLAGQDVCKPAYKCTSVNGNPRSMQGANSCADCADTKDSEGNCLTGCAACCTHFGATECGCDDNSC